MPSRVLVVDDEPHIVRLIQVNLERQGYQVETANNGAQALAKIRESRPDLLVSDVMMPEMDGFELLANIRRDATLMDLPVIMLTAKAQDKDVMTGYQTGADMYLTKPFNPAELIAFAAANGGAARAAEDAEPASPIVAAIARALTERGWTVRHQVGCGAYKVDLAVVDPNDPGRYVLAIEHDGAAYGSAPAARDRDRLRAQVLAQLGWRLHRIWSLDWWADPERELQRAHAAIVTALAASRQRRTHATTPPKPRPTRSAVATGSAATPRSWICPSSCSPPRRRTRT